MALTFVPPGWHPNLEIPENTENNVWNENATVKKKGSGPPVGAGDSSFFHTWLGKLSVAKGDLLLPLFVTATLLTAYGEVRSIYESPEEHGVGFLQTTKPGKCAAQKKQSKAMAFCFVLAIRLIFC
ncbi:hypothetical protein MG293_018666 [Ovis ammon polii]|uniref:Uncharacterized protein n=1 Tax=Ovis ammon polii TaxID=230172 RepID=A0AAD4TMF3_OVIAM|nr:hypothetical protein MG293_018666 [Ovis ammon polii]